LIHPTAIVSPKASLDSSVKVGPYSIIDAEVKIGAGSVIGNHVTITGNTTIGKNNHIYHYSSIGEAPQDKKYNQEKTFLEIGDNNTIREFCTFNRGTAQDHGLTKIGNDNWIMAYVHIAHDCEIKNQIILANNTSLAGHVSIDDYAILGGGQYSGL
jgi:UDP-N-acetylglucosamine acyltransferase